MRRFMIGSRAIHGGLIPLDGELYNHMVRVLRMETGSPLILVDGDGREHEGSVERVERERVIVRVTRTLTQGDSMEELPPLTICQALPKGEKTDLILQKGTELGVHDFLLFGGRRSVPRIRPEQRDAKLERWNRITAEAARQCGRRSVPAVAWAPDTERAISSCGHDLRLVLWEGEERRSLGSVLDHHPRPESVVVAIGPEGGLDGSEVNSFREGGFLPVTLGRRILRTETASLAVTSVLQYIWGNL